MALCNEELHEQSREDSKPRPRGLKSGALIAQLRRLLGLRNSFIKSEKSSAKRKALLVFFFFFIIPLHHPLLLPR